MNAFQKTIAQCPWVPIIGNHEAADGDHFQRFLNMTWGEAYGAESEKHRSSVRSSATSAIGHLLSKAYVSSHGVTLETRSSARWALPAQHVL